MNFPSNSQTDSERDKLSIFNIKAGPQFRWPVAYYRDKNHKPSWYKRSEQGQIQKVSNYVSFTPFTTVVNGVIDLTEIIILAPQNYFTIYILFEPFLIHYNHVSGFGLPWLDQS